MTGFDEAGCLDVVQDAMLKAATSMPRLHKESQLAAWMNRVMLNAARDRVRSEDRRRRREDARAVHAPERASDEDIEELMRTLDRLDEEQKELLHARFSLGWTLQRIAESLGLGAGAVDGRIKRALAQLRDDFDRDHRKELGSE
jgi:RNA polymerase sigma factor (sigma-70 family)